MMSLISTSRCPFAARGLLIAAVSLLAAPAFAADDDEIRFEVATGVSAHARLLGDGSVEVGTNRSPARQVLPASTDEEGDGTRLGHADYNFDGYQDLDTSATLGQVNESVTVYLYEPASGQFRALAAPEAPEISCEGFWSLTPDPATRTLSSSCRSGPMWYSDIYRYQGGQVYLYRSMRNAFLDTEALAQVLALAEVEDAEILTVWSTWDAAGKRLETAIWNAFDPPLKDAPMPGRSASVVPEKLLLYSKAGDTSTKRYLLKGDRVELLDEADGWLQLRYRNPRRGPVLGWVRLPSNE
ncbi:SH3 domain-containing protein [Stenotrophomonas sp.]|uniref:XAC2610-related protein n=1 Tax=Stenotrophomonas sp. TaxID=69392 RepID=UPI0028AFBE42|nr:SH3 domain-containing protein [Stenotrophomonas sp.]